MDYINILHIADVHIGAKFRFLEPTNARIRRDEILSTFIDTVLSCKEKKVDILLISGDLFDNNSPDKDSVTAIKNAFKEIPHTAVFIALGNHDFMSMDFVYEDNFPKNVHIFSSNWECMSLPKVNVNVFGKSFDSTYKQKSFLNDFPSDISSDTINIMLMHGDVVSEGTQSVYNPVTEIQLLNSNMDYIALGHIHKATNLKKLGTVSYAYSGSPEGMGFDEIGEKGIYIGKIFKGKCELDFVPVCKRRFIEIKVDISDCEIIEDICKLITNSIKDEAGENFEKNFYKITLTGKNDINIDIPVITAKLEETFFCCRIKDKTTAETDIEFLSNEKTVNGVFAKNMLTYYLDNGETDMAKKAFSFGLKALSGEAINSEN